MPYLFIVSFQISIKPIVYISYNSIKRQNNVTNSLGATGDTGFLLSQVFVKVGLAANQTYGALLEINHYHCKINNYHALHILTQPNLSSTTIT